MKAKMLLCLSLISGFILSTSASDIDELYPQDNETKIPTNNFGLFWIDVAHAPDQTVTYDLYLGTDTNPGLIASDISDGWVDGTAMGYTFEIEEDSSWFIFNDSGIELLSNTQYYWKVVAHLSDGSDISSSIFSFTTIRENTPPSKPQLTYPASYAIDIPHNNLTIQWTASIDAENDPVTYRLYFGTGNNNPPLLIDNLTTNSYQIPFLLEDQARYYWRVEAIDGYDETVVSSIQYSFLVENYVNDPPSAPIALSPDNETNVGNEIIFKWTESTDQDNDDVRYNIYADDNSNPSTLVAEEIIYDQWYTIPLDASYEKVYWKVEATDGEYSVESQILSYIPYEQPKAPVPLVSDAAINVGKRPTLAWTAASPNPESGILYDFYLDTNPDPKTLVAPGLKEPTFSPVVNAPQTTYYWKVVTRDETGVLFESPVSSFTPWKNGNEAISIEMIDVEGGEFLMGSAEYEIILPGFETWGKLYVENMTPQRTIFLDDYSMAKYEITYAQYFAFLDAIQDSWYVDEANNKLMYQPASLIIDNGNPIPANPITLCSVKSDASAFDFQFHSKLSWDGNSLSIRPGFENYPANWLTVKGMELFLDWAGKRAPTEAEWEYAARGGKQSMSYKYGGTNTGTQSGWYLYGEVNMDNPMTGNNYGTPEKNNKGTNVVGLKAVNELGFYDISGNVRDFCSDYYNAKQYLKAEYYNPQGPITGESKVGRGGCFKDLETEIMTLARNIASYGLTGIRAADNYSTSNTVLAHGIVRDEYGKPVEGINFSTAKATATSSTSGRYQLRVQKGKVLVIQPSHPDYTFSPSEIRLNGLESVTTELNFTAYLNRKVKIAGKVTDTNGKGLDGVLIKGFPDEVITYGNGAYAVYLPEGKTWQISVNERGYKPTAERMLMLEQTDLTDVNFELEYVGYKTLSGKVTHWNTGEGQPNVLISGLDSPVYTQGDGTYFTQVTLGWSGTLKPVKKGGTFTPATYEIVSFSGNMEVNFEDVGSGEIFYSGNVVDVHGKPLEGVKILGFENKGATTSKSGEFGLQIANGWTGTIRPQLEGYTFSPASHEALVANDWDTPPPTHPYFVATPSGAYTVSGTVNTTEGKPLQGVLLNGFGQEVRTDLNGKYSVWVDAASYNIQPVLQGYNFTPENIAAEVTNANITKDFTATELSDPTYTITFFISDGNNAIENATITLDGNTYTTDSNGQVVINSMATGVYPYAIQATGYEHFTGSATLIDQNIQETVSLTIEEIPTFTLTLSISNANEHIHNAMVNINEASFSSDENGQLLITDLPAGIYPYSITAAGYHEKSGSIVINDQNVQETIILIAEEIPVYTITLSITDGSKPLANALLTLNDTHYTADESGQLIISHLPAASYEYSVSADGYLSSSGTISLIDQDVQQTIKLQAEATPTYTLTFSISDQQQAVSNATIHFNGDSYTSNAHGQAIIENIPAGNYTYTVSASGYLTVDASLTVIDQNILHALTLEAEEEPTFTLTFVLSDGSKKISDALVHFQGGDYVPDSEGKVLIRKILPGTYHYAISAEGYASPEGSVTISDADVTEEIQLIVTSIDEDISKHITCYPNPSDGIVHIDIKGYTFKEGYIKLVNPLGQSQMYALTPNIYAYEWATETNQANNNNEGIYMMLIYLDSRLVDSQKLIFNPK